MVKIDAHQHFWKFDEVRDSWITPDMEIIRRDFLPADLSPVLEANGFIGCVAVQADQTPGETDFLLSLAKENDFIKGLVGWVDLRAGNLEEQLSEYRLHPLIKGFRHIVQAEEPGFMLQPAFIRGIKLLTEFGFTYDILVRSVQIHEAAELARRCPEQSFVLDHLGKPGIKNAEISDWRSGLEQVAELPNVYCKLSGLVTEADQQNWQPGDIFPYLDIAFELFGTSRLMYGSDWPVCKLAAEYDRVVALIDNYIASLTIAEQAMVWSGNARQFYKLDIY